MKYEIIINPKNDQECGKCTYSKIVCNAPRFIPNYICLLFKRDLTPWIQSTPELPMRCYECKKLTENFIKIPELPESY